MPMEDDKKEENKNLTTVESAMNYVDTPAANFSSWKVKDLGLQFLLFGIAELNAKRAIRLQGFISDLEDIVFDPDLLRELQPKEYLGAYKLAAEVHKDTLDFISKTRREMNWDAIQTQLAEMTANEASEDGDIDITRMANKLIEQISKPKKEIK